MLCQKVLKDFNLSPEQAEGIVSVYALLVHLTTVKIC